MARWGSGRDVAGEALVRAGFEEHGRAMMAYATRLLGDADAAQDVVQEALLRAWRNPEALTNGKGSVRGWLLTVVRNLVIDRVRSAAGRPVLSGEGSVAEVAVRDHADEVVNAVVVLDALERLSTEH